MNKYSLPTSVEINGVECKIDSDYRNILHVMEILTDPDLLPQEAAIIALQWFYEDTSYMKDLQTALTEMFAFISVCDKNKKGQDESQKEVLYDWDKDFNIIIAPINRILGYDVRGVEYLHWWTFMSAFMEIGECTFSVYVGIRKKLARGIKLEKYEEKIYKEHYDDIILPKRYDKTTQELIDLIMGTEEE